MKTLLSGTVTFKNGQVWHYELYRKNLAVSVNTEGHMLLSCPETVQHIVPWQGPLFPNPKIDIARDATEPNRHAVIVYFKPKKRWTTVAAFFQQRRT